MPLIFGIGTGEDVNTKFLSKEEVSQARYSGSASKTLFINVGSDTAKSLTATDFSLFPGYLFLNVQWRLLAIEYRDICFGVEIPRLFIL